jgi:hypothetical protein
VICSVRTQLTTADTYRVDFGIKTKAGEESRTITCQFGEMCCETVAAMGLRVGILIFRSHRERATVHVYGGDLSCCYFIGAADSSPLALQADYLKSLAGCFSTLCFALFCIFFFEQEWVRWLPSAIPLLMTISTARSWKTYEDNCNHQR